MNRLQSVISWVVLTSEVSHLFCCGIPVVFSLLSLLSGVGVIVAMPLGLHQLHEVMHHYEQPILIASGCIVAFGWVLNAVANKIDCRNTGCAHEPCASKKKRSTKILIVATIIFIINIMIYLLFHH